MAIEEFEAVGYAVKAQAAELATVAVSFDPGMQGGQMEEPLFPLCVGESLDTSLNP